MEHYLGEKLKKLRESRGWTQADLAKRLNKAVSTISGYESDSNGRPGRRSDKRSLSCGV